MSERNHSSMSKAYLLTVCLLLSSLTGCVDDDGEVKITVEPVVEKPVATILSVNPNPVSLSALEKTGVTFTGKGESENGYILEYDWGSSIDGFLSSEKSFTTKNLSLGEHTIFFKVLSDELVWSEKASTILNVVNNTFTGNNTSKFTEVPKWDFFYVDDPNLDVLRNGTREFAVGVANLGNYSHEFTVASNSGIGSIWAFPIYINSSAFEKIPGYSEHLEGHGSQVLGYYHGTTFVLEPNGVQVIIFRTSFIDNAIDRSELEILANTTWHNNSNSLIGETRNLTFVMSAIEFGQNGQQVEIGNYTDSYYAGFLASNGRLFDTNIENIWDNYEYRRAGVTDSNKHTSILSAFNVGCNGENDPSENCDGSKGMIEGFDAGMLGMYVGQTKYVVIPPELAYGETGSSNSDLAGETLIFSITIVSID